MGLLAVIILGSIATWRLALMLQDESGPFAIFEKLRMQVNKLDYNNGGIRDGFNCFYCLSIWIGIFFTALFLLLPVVFFILVTFLTMSAIAIFINITKERLE